MSILFSEIYTKAIALFDDPKITKAYKTNEIQFDKLMYTYLQNAIALFTNPASIGMRLAYYNEPEGVMETFDGDGSTVTFGVDSTIDLTKENCIYTFIEGEIIVDSGAPKLVEGTTSVYTFDNGKVFMDTENKIITFPDILPQGQQYAFEQYYVGEFLDDFASGFNSKTSAGNKLVLGEIKDILARLLVKAWAEEERNLLLDIRNLMQDSDFKITGNDRILKAKNLWVDQLDTEILQLSNKLAWNIRFMYSSQTIGRG